MSLVGISYYGGPVSYGFFIVLTAIPMVSLFYIICVIFRFKVYQRLDGRNLVSNRTSPFFFTLQNESHILFAGIRVGFYSDYSSISGLDDMTEYELLSHSGIKKETGLICRYRGEYEVGIKRITVQDHFRLFTVSYDNREPLRVTVKPDIVKLPVLGSDRQNVISAKDSGLQQTEPDITVREYLPTDDKRLINWKATAAAAKLMVREQTGQQQRGVGLIMNSKRCSCRPQIYLPSENKILETVIALVLYYCGKNVPVNTCFWSGGLNEFTINGMERFESFYELMSGISFDMDLDMGMMYKEVLRSAGLTECRALFYVTYTWDEETSGFIKELSKRGSEVTVYIIGENDTMSFAADTIPRCSIIMIPAEADLTEVM